MPLLFTYGRFSHVVAHLQSTMKDLYIILLLHIFSILK